MLTALLLALPLAADAAMAPPAAPEAVVRDAIIDAVRQRMGPAAGVIVEDLHVMATVDLDTVIAVPDPTDRLGRTMRFTLQAGATRAGSADATVRVSVEHVHTRHAMAAGDTIEAADVVAVNHELAAGPLRALPEIEQVLRGRVTRPLGGDQCILATSVVARPLVQTGDEVTALVRDGVVEVSAHLVAGSSGNAGAVVRVVNTASRRALKARVVGKGVVEVMK